MSIANLFSDSIGSNQLNPISIAEWNAIPGIASGSVASVSNTDGNLTIAPTTGAVVCDLANDVSIPDSLTVGTANATGQFYFDTNGNLTLPLNSNTTGSTEIIGGSSSSSNNSIDMYVNYSASSGAYGAELLLSNSLAVMGINGVSSNTLTNFVGVNNTSNPNSGSFAAQVVNPTTRDVATIGFNTSTMELAIPLASLELDNSAIAGEGRFIATCINSNDGQTYSMIFKADPEVGGFLYAPYIGAANFNVAGAYDLATTVGSSGSVLTSGGDGTTSWQNPISVGAQYINLNGFGALPLTTGANLTWSNYVNTSAFTTDMTNITLPPNSVFFVSASFTGVNQILGGGGFQFDLVPTNCTFSGNATAQISNATVGAQTCVINGIIVTTGAAGAGIKFTYAANTLITNGGCSATIYLI